MFVIKAFFNLFVPSSYVIRMDYRLLFNFGRILLVGSILAIGGLILLFTYSSLPWLKGILFVLTIVFVLISTIMYYFDGLHEKRHVFMLCSWYKYSPELFHKIFSNVGDEFTAHLEFEGTQRCGVVREIMDGINYPYNSGHANRSADKLKYMINKFIKEVNRDRRVLQFYAL